MTARKKAQELFEKYWSLKWQVHKTTRTYKQEMMSKSAAKQCALIAVDEIINHCSQVEPFLGVDYWREVKTELLKL